MFVRFNYIIILVNKMDVNDNGKTSIEDGEM